MTPEHIQRPQIFYGMSYEDYAKIDAINSSAYKRGITSSHMEAYLSGAMDDNDTSDRRFGRAMHCGILEAKVLSDRFPVAETCCQPLKSGARKDEPCGASGKFRSDGKWYCGKHKPAEGRTEQFYDFMTPDEVERLEKIIEKFKRSVAWEYMNAGKVHTEVVITWFRGDVMHKTRIDWLMITDSFIVIVDLKKSKVGETDLESCRRKAWKARYDIQGKMNVEGVRAYFGTRRPISFHLLFQEDSAPFENNLIPAIEDDLTVAARDMDARLTLYKDAQKRRCFTGYQMIPENIESSRGILPDWVIQKRLLSDEINAEEDDDDDE